MGDRGGRNVEAAVLGAAHQIEKALDDEIKDLNNVPEEDIEIIRRRRIAEMKKKAEQEALWRRRGHGKLTRLEEKEFFAHAKEADRFVLLVTRPGTSRFAQDIEEHFGRIAESHLETFFANLDADKAPFLCEKFMLRVMPSVLLVKSQTVDKVLHGLDAFVDTGKKLDTAVIESRLFEFGMVTHTDIADSK
jgi:hypothetical protein